MARQPQITRTITTTTAKFLVVHLDTKVTEAVELTLPRQYKDDAAMLKMAEKRNEDKSLKFVAVLDTPVVRKKLWGMSEDEFIDKGHELPPRGSHADAESVEA